MAQETLSPGTGARARAMGDPVPARATTPVPSIGTIARPGISRLLDAAATRRLTVVSAGPGWGKTMAVAQWVTTENPRLRWPVAWLTLEARDNSPGGFWNGVLGAIRASGAVPDDHPLAQASTAGGISPEVLVTLHQGLDTLPGPLLLVLDDFHLLDHPAVLEVVHRMVDHDSPVRLMLLTRVDPFLPLHTLRLEGHLTEVTSRELAFGPVEVDQMGRAAGLALTPADIDHILARTEGWPAGVRLATLYLSRSPGEPGLAAFTGSERSVAEYLLAEVLDRNTPATRDFLLRTSVAERLSGDLADAIVPGAGGQALLEGLERTNQFVTALGADRVWFRYHPLLRDLLAHALKRDDLGAHREAHRAAATWLAAHSDPLDALGHAAAAEDWSLFTTIFTEAAAPSVVGVGRPTLSHHLGAVPYSQLPDSVPIQLCAAALALGTGNVDAMDGHVDRARALLVDDGIAESPSTVTLLDLLIGARARHRGDAPGAVLTAAAAQAAVDHADPFPAAESYRAIAAHNRGVGLLWLGRTQEARASLDAVQRHDPPGDIEITRLTARAHLAICHVVEARLDEAQHSAEVVLEAATIRGWRSMFWTRPAHWSLGFTRLLQGDTVAAGAAITAGLAADVGGVEPGPRLALHITQGSVAVSQGRAKAAAQARDQARVHASDWAQPGFLLDEIDRLDTDLALLTAGQNPASGFGAARLGDTALTPTQLASHARRLLAAGDATRARQVAADITATSEHATIADLIALVEAWIVQAQASARSQHRHDALTALENAVHLARPHHLLRPFLIASGGVAPLMRALAGGPSPSDAFTADLRARLTDLAPQGPEPPPLLEPLTERELAVLAELPTMKSNGEIADEFHVSVNTVKAHLKSLYRKLDVTSRRDAVRRGRELFLLR